jgi:type II secretory ATPase GspE/PulE/Tfp pilus assembly ATPase PilB-like protein
MTKKHLVVWDFPFWISDLFRISLFEFRTSLTAGLFFLFAADGLWAAPPSFPRGPGFYYSLFNLAVMIASFWGWVKLASWLDDDANRCGLDAPRWNTALLGVSVVGFLVVWKLSWFWFSLFFFWAGVLGLTFLYIHYRNQRVTEADRLLTHGHWLGLLHRYAALFARKVQGTTQEQKVPVRFMSRSTTGEEFDHQRDERVRESRGYKAAQEMVWEAITKRATDIHLEPSEDHMLIRLRVDGIMANTTPFSRGMGEAVINIFKVLCNLDITERRKPQDGSFSAQVGRTVGPGEWQYRLVDFRVATAGSVAGEKLVMRILDASQQLTDLTQVGMTDSMRKEVHELITRPHGMFLVCGPTGSGKSTTLYACLHEIDRFSQNVITIENPVEFHLENVTQIEVNPKAGKTFASELRSILRQDPDVIMVGEIRDKETAEIACQAAQTGHLVFSTVHANDTVTAIGRLIDLGVQPFMIASALTAVLGQRLVRRLCPRCRVRYKPNADTLKRLNADTDQVRFLYRIPDAPQRRRDEEEDEEATCDECGGAGYCRRTGVFELLVINEAIRERIRANPDLNAIRRDAVQAGMLTLFEDGARLVIEGDTSIQELLRVAK